MACGRNKKLFHLTVMRRGVSFSAVSLVNLALITHLLFRSTHSIDDDTVASGGGATPRYSAARKPSPAPGKVRFDASVAGGTPHYPKGWRPLNLPYISYEVEVIEGVAGRVKFQEICVWLLSGSMAKPPNVRLSPDHMTVIVEYQSAHFFKPKFLLGNKSNHHPSRYIIWRNSCHREVAAMTKNGNKCPCYIMEIPLDIPAREIIYQGKQYTKMDWEHGSRKEEQTLDAQRILIRLDWDDDTFKEECPDDVAEYRSEPDSTEEETEENFRRRIYSSPSRPNHARASASHPRPISSSRSTPQQSTPRSMISLGGSNASKRPRRSAKKAYPAPTASVQTPGKKTPKVSKPPMTVVLSPIRSSRQDCHEDFGLDTDITTSPSPHDKMEFEWGNCKFDGEVEEEEGEEGVGEEEAVEVGDDETKYMSPINKQYALEIYRRLANFAVSDGEAFGSL